MFLFWLGTAPLLSGLGVFSANLIKLVRQHATVMICFALLATGGWVAYKGIRSVNKPVMGATVPACHSPSQEHRF